MTALAVTCCVLGLALGLVGYLLGRSAATTIELRRATIEQAKMIESLRNVLRDAEAEMIQCEEEALTGPPRERLQKLLARAKKLETG